MATYGARYLQWAPFAKEGADIAPEAFPKYGTPRNLGPLVMVSDAITYASGDDFGDNQLKEHVDEFVKIDVDVEITEMDNATAAEVYGATVAESTDIEYGAEDAQPYGGLAFYVCKLIDGVKTYQGIYYPKVKATRQGVSYNTKGSSITFANAKAHFTGTTCLKGRYQVHSDYLETEAAAKAWVDGLIKATV